MHRLTRYALAIVAAGIGMGIGAIVDGSPLVLAGIAEVYAVGTAIVLRGDVRSHLAESGGAPDTVFVAVTIFSVLMIAQGTTKHFGFAAAILAFGLAHFGFACGIWTTIESDRAE